VEHFGGTFYANPVEAAEMANDVPATAEALMPQTNADGTTSYFVEGDITTPTDLDHFAMDVPAGTTKVSAFCSAQRDGSGLRGFKTELLDANGVTLTGGLVTEDPAQDLGVSQIPFPTGATKLLLKLSAGSQDATVTGTYYRCGVTFAP